MSRTGRGTTAVMPSTPPKIETELGWKPGERFETGLRKTVQWYFEHMVWVENVTSGAYRNWVDTNYSNRGMA